MKRVQKKKKNIKRVFGFTALTLALVCVFAVGFFAIKEGSIFGKYEDPYVTGDAENISQDMITVTSQDEYSSVLTVDSSVASKYTGLNELPEIPEAKVGYEKGTKENPFVILEIVPELSQQSMSYYSSSQEEGLPFDPLEFSMSLSKEKNHSIFKKESTDDTIYDNTENKNYTYKKSEWTRGDAVKVENCDMLNGLEGIFASLNSEPDNQYKIYDYDGSVIGTERKTSGEEYDYSLAPLIVLDSYYTVEMEKGISFTKKLSKQENGGSFPTIASLYDGNPEFKEAFVDKDNQEIPREVLEDDLNWAWKVEKDSDTTKKFTISISSPTAEFESDFVELKSGALDKIVFLDKYKDILSKADDGTAVTTAEFERTEAWTFNDAQDKYKGYFVNVGAGNGDIEAGSVWNIYPKDGGSWKYVVDASQLPENGTNLWPDGKQNWEVANTVAAAKEGDYYAVSSIGPIYNTSLASMLESTKTYTVNYNYEGYKLKFEYVGLKWNDILKRMLFNFKDEVDENGKVIKTADQQYEEYHMKTIVLTPDMINAMDRNDTVDTLDYIERADLFYVNSNYGNPTVECKKMREFYYKYVEGDKEEYKSRADDSTLKGFEESDLEWNDCMKIVKRLSGDAGLPMMYSKAIGHYFETHNQQVTHRVFDNKEVNSEKNTLCNIGKMYLITTMFDLSAQKVTALDLNLVDFSKISDEPVRETLPDYGSMYITSGNIDSLQELNISKGVVIAQGKVNIDCDFEGVVLGGEVETSESGSTYTYEKDQKKLLDIIRENDNLSKYFYPKINSIWTFMENVYGDIQQVKIASNTDSNKNTAVYTGYFKGFEENLTDSKATFLWDMFTFVPYVTTDNKDAIFKKPNDPNKGYTDSVEPHYTEIAETLVSKYGFLASSFTGIYSTEAFGSVERNLSENGYKQILGKNSGNYDDVTGTRDPVRDFQNVTVVMAANSTFVTYMMEQTNKNDYENAAGTFLKKNNGGIGYNNTEKIDNGNYTIFRQGTMTNMCAILANILKNGKAPTPTMSFSIKPMKKYYQKMSDNNILIDYSQSASYSEDEKRTKQKNVLKLYCNLSNAANKEVSVITSIKMIDPNDSSKPEITINNIYDYDDNIIQKESKIGFSKVLPSPKKYKNEFLDGYGVSKTNSQYGFVIPFKLTDWQKGYTTIRIDWVARTSAIKKGIFTPYQNPSDPTNSDIVDSAHQYAEIDIGERELFDLE